MKPLDAYDRWMVRKNLEHAEHHGIRPIVEQLIDNGYPAVAAAVEQEWEKRTPPA